ncbi:MAG: DUF5681 domain-containing protein [Taibaiella sp.]|jgi:hypothetical protein
MKFKKGASGNITGRPKGIVDQRTKLRKLLEPHAEKLVHQAVTMALAGDASALKLCIDRLIPPIRARDESTPPINTKGSLVDQGEAVIAAMNTGRVSQNEAINALQAMITLSKIKETHDLEQRIAALEDKEI